MVDIVSKTLGELIAAAALDGSDRLPISQDGGTTLTRTTLNSIAAFISAMNGSAANIPIGGLVDFCGSSPPAGFLVCNGSAISRSTYAALFAVIGTAYGPGNGSTTFNIPDFRGRVAVGSGTGSGLTARSLGDSFGAESVALVEANNGPHRHFEFTNESGDRPTLTGSNQPKYSGTDGSSDNEYTINGSTIEPTLGRSSSSGSGTPHNNVQPSLVATKLIRYQ